MGGGIKEYRFTIEEKTIPTLTEGPVRSLGKLFYNALQDRSAIEETREEFDSWMAKIDEWIARAVQGLAITPQCASTAIVASPEL